MPQALVAQTPASVLLLTGAEYDETRDRLRLTLGEQTAVTAAPTPEGHIVRRAVADGELCGVVITDVRRRLSEEARIEVSLGRDGHLSLCVQDIAALLTRAARGRVRRFARATP